MTKISPELHTESAFSFVGGHHCLDFVNTEVMRQGERLELLPSADQFVAWLSAANLLTPDAAEQAHQFLKQPEDGATILTWVRVFRWQLRMMLDQIILGETVAPAIVAEINRWLAFQGGRLQLVQPAHGFCLQWQAAPSAPAHLLVPVAVVAADLLAEHDLTLIKRCDNPQCIRYFYDATKNHSRRWCSMDTCGNRMKVAAYYRRKRQEEHE
ncbi:MAG: CGNR zinc finger domain-containing protein [Chloroflexales bacterium]|nr:CGNR zinc finger domain-containing protein [Chloroflexales bacterium]